MPRRPAQYSGCNVWHGWPDGLGRGAWGPGLLLEGSSVRAVASDRPGRSGDEAKDPPRPALRQEGPAGGRELLPPPEIGGSPAGVQGSLFRPIRNDFPTDP